MPEKLISLKIYVTERDSRVYGSYNTICSYAASFTFINFTAQSNARNTLVFCIFPQAESCYGCKYKRRYRCLHLRVLK